MKPIINLEETIGKTVGKRTPPKDAFAYAESFDEENKRYRGLRAGHHVSISLDGNGIIVNAEIAAVQLAIEKAEADEKAKVFSP